jgi:TolA-binding protein
VGTADTNEGRGRRILRDALVSISLVLVLASVYWYDRPELKTASIRGLWNLERTTASSNRLAAASGEDSPTGLTHTGATSRPTPRPASRPNEKGSAPRPSAPARPSGKSASSRETGRTPLTAADDAAAKLVEAPPAADSRDGSQQPEDDVEGFTLDAESQAEPDAETAPETDARMSAAAAEATAAESLRVASVLQRVGDLNAACKELRTLVASFPQTSSAAEARRRLPELEATLAERQCEDVLRLAAETQATGKIEEARQMLLAVIHGFPDSSAADRAKARLQAMTQAEQEQRVQAEAAAREQVAARQAASEAAAARLLQQAMAAEEKKDLAEAQRLLTLIAQNHAGTPAAQEARRVERAVDAAREEQRTAQMLEQAKLAHQEGRFREAQRLLERVAQDHPRSAAAQEAARLILQVMAAARDQSRPAVVTYREPATPFRASPPPRRDATGSSSVGDSERREPRAAADEEQSQQALELAKGAHQEGRFDDARRQLERLAQDYPNTPAAQEAARLILTVMADAREQSRPSVVTYREPAAPFRAALPPRRAADDSPPVRDSERRERNMAANEEQSQQALELAKTAHQEGRFDDARRQLERLAQNYPQTPAAREAARLILLVMADARQEQAAAVVTYREPAATPPSVARPRPSATVGQPSVSQPRDAPDRLEQSKRALELAKTAHQEGRFDDARRQLERLAQDYPQTPAAQEAARLILLVMAAARQEKETAVIKYREPAAPVTRPAAPPRPAPPTATVRDSQSPSRDAAVDVEQSKRALELAKAAHQQGRFNDARRQLERLAQDYPQTSAAQEAARLILVVMADARQAKDPPLVKYRAPVETPRPAAPSRRDHGKQQDTRKGSKDTVADADLSNRLLQMARTAYQAGQHDDARLLLERLGREYPHTSAAKAGSRLILQVMAAARQKQQSPVTTYPQPAPTVRTPTIADRPAARPPERTPTAGIPKPPPAAPVAKPDPQAREEVARLAEQLWRDKSDPGYAAQPKANAKE